MLTLYDYELSGNCYKLRLFMNILGVKYETKSVDFYPGREHKSEWFLKINPLGQLPVLQDGDLVLRDAQAILVYLAARYDQSGLWYPLSDAAALGRVSMWLAFADAITATASAARLHDGLFYDIDINTARAGAHKLFRILDEHLVRRARGTRFCREPRPPDHRRHRLLSLRDAVGRRRRLPSRLSGYPPMVRSFQANGGLHCHVGYLPNICRQAGDQLTRPRACSLERIDGSARQRRKNVSPAWRRRADISPSTLVCQFSTEGGRHPKRSRLCARKAPTVQMWPPHPLSPAPPFRVCADRDGFNDSLVFRCRARRGPGCSKTEPLQLAL